jgi:Kelch motif
VPPWNQAYLWPDTSNSSFYQWGGTKSDFYINLNTSTSALYAFLPDNRGGGEWTEQGQTSTSLFKNLLRTFEGAATSKGDTWYKVGGAISCGSDPNVLDCSQSHTMGPIISYNSTSNLWTNDSVQDFTPAGSALFSRMHNIPFGSPYGLNVILGGGTASWSRPAPVGIPPDLLDFKHIYLYDPTTKAFHNQTATGDLPTPRIGFCSVGTPGPNGTYEIFIYGGYDPSLLTQHMMLTSDEVFVLSLPGFVWFKAGYPPVSARHMHTCDITGRGGNQMVVVGGLDPTVPTSQINVSTDPWTNGINVFDLSIMRWKDAYDPNDASYQTPSVVRDWYAQNGPYPSWDYPAVQSLFIEASTITSLPQPTINPADYSNRPLSNKPNIGAIVGGALGGLALLLVTAAVVYFFARRRKPDDGITEHGKPELEAGIGKQRQKSMQQGGELGPKHELSGTRVLELSSGEMRHEVGPR